MLKKLIPEKLSEYDQEIPQSHTADQITLLRGRATINLQSQDTRKTVTIKLLLI